jgi:hypothetical protein
MRPREGPAKAFLSSQRLWHLDAISKLQRKRQFGAPHSFILPPRCQLASFAASFHCFRDRCVVTGRCHLDQNARRVRIVYLARYRPIMRGREASTVPESSTVTS